MLAAAIEQLRSSKTAALKAKYKEVFSQEAKSSNRQFLLRRIAWQLQALAEGGLTERARKRATQIANEADLRTRPPKQFPARSGITNSVAHSSNPQRDYRLPPPGTLITRRHKGRDIIVKVLEDGFEYQSRKYQSLSAVAREVTGTQWNGLRFFLGKRDG